MKPYNNRIVLIDASPSGVSGDKYLGALLDLGGRPEVLRKVAKIVAETLPGTGKLEVKMGRAERGEIGGQFVTIESAKEPAKRKGKEVLDVGQKCVQNLGLSSWGSSFALSTLNTLLQAESKVHGHSSDNLELHELGSADTLVDVLGVASLAESLGLATATWWSTPVAVGRGTARFSNKDYPNPPPAVAEILRDNHFPMEQGLTNVELSTPTGVAITVNLVTKYSDSYPALRPEKVGYGSGSREFAEIPNVLRLTVGQILEAAHSHDQMVILETNLDDVSGEVIGRAAEKLMASGARDVTITPVYMKKNRPGHVISVISAKNDVERLADVLIAETGTLGVRELPIVRHITPRKTSEIRLKIGDQEHHVRMKISQDRHGRVLGSKPEYEDLKRISDQTGMSLREIQKLVKPKLESFLASESKE